MEDTIDDWRLIAAADRYQSWPEVEKLADTAVSFVELVVERAVRPLAAAGDTAWILDRGASHVA